MTKCLCLMGRFKKNLVCISININETFEKNEKSQKNHCGILKKVLISQLVYVLGF